MAAVVPRSSYDAGKKLRFHKVYHTIKLNTFNTCCDFCVLLLLDPASEEEEENLCLSYSGPSDQNNGGSSTGAGLVVDLTSAGQIEDDDSDDDVEVQSVVPGNRAAFQAGFNQAPASMKRPLSAMQAGDAAAKQREHFIQQELYRRQYAQQQQRQQQQQQQQQQLQQHQQLYRLYGQEFTFAVQSHKAVECKWTGALSPSQVAIGCVNAFISHYSSSNPKQFW